MRPFAFGPNLTITKRCSHCDTALEFEPITGGRVRVVFTAHDEKFCAAATRDRVHLLERVLLEQREAYERALARQRRWIDKVMRDNGLPTTAERAEDDVRRAMASTLFSQSD